MLRKILISIITFCIITSGIYINSKRYEISSPMEDLEYKKKIITSSKNLTYKLENLRPLVGPNELERFIRENNDNPEIYTPSEENIKKGIYQANLHMHTTNSDGQARVEYILDQAESYAKKNLKGKPFYLSITDHNTILGAKELIEVLQKNPQKYKNIKVICGIEIFTAYNNSSVAKRPVDIHVLGWCINPYDKFLNKEFYKKNLKDKWNRQLPDRDFDFVITELSNYGLIGIAHPARYIDFLGKENKNYIKELLQHYKSKNKNKVCYLEGYYQVYPLIIKNYDEEFKNLLDYINLEAKAQGICRTGSTDVHGYSIFKK